MTAARKAELTIRLVDDHDGVRTSLRRFLETYGFGVRDYASGEAFLADLPATGRGCLILDYFLPGLDGLEILRQAQSQGCFLPVIMLTGNEDPLLEKLALQSGVRALLKKPTDLYGLASRVEEATDG